MQVGRYSSITGINTYKIPFPTQPNSSPPKRKKKTGDKAAPGSGKRNEQIQLLRNNKINYHERKYDFLVAFVGVGLDTPFAE